jgi:hypothetical protein
MKKLLFPMLMVFAILLSACSTSSTRTPTGSTSNDLAIETQLAVGTLKLEGTDQDVSVEQAQELVVLWQVYREISQSETAAQAEVDGLIAQIQATMTTDQMQAITDMQVTQQDVFASMQGVTVVSSSSDGDTISLPSGGSMPAGGPPSDGGGAPPDGGMPADMGGAVPASGVDQSQSEQASLGFESTADVPTALVEAVIQSLQQKIAA